MPYNARMASPARTVGEGPQRSSGAASLYETDFYSWARVQAAALRRRDAAAIDWDNVTEEIESLGRRERSAWTNTAARAIEHMLKIAHWERASAPDLRHWMGEIATWRDQMADTIQDSPGLQGRYGEMLRLAWHRGRRGGPPRAGECRRRARGRGSQEIPAPRLVGADPGALPLEARRDRGVRHPARPGSRPAPGAGPRGVARARGPPAQRDPRDALPRAGRGARLESLNTRAKATVRAAARARDGPARRRSSSKARCHGRRRRHTLVSVDCKRISRRRVEALLREEFSREIEAQRDKVPDWGGIASMAGLGRRTAAGTQRGPSDASLGVTAPELPRP